MTKTVRIENADTSPYKVRVRAQHLIQENGKPATWQDTTEPVFTADYPTGLITATITSHRRLIVEEYQ